MYPKSDNNLFKISKWEPLNRRVSQRRKYIFNFYGKIRKRNQSTGDFH